MSATIKKHASDETFPFRRWSAMGEWWESTESLNFQSQSQCDISPSLIRTAERERWIQSGSGVALNKLLSALIVSLFLSLTCKRCGPCWAHKRCLTAAIVCRWVNYIPHTVLLSNNSFICLTRTVNSLAPCKTPVIREDWICCRLGSRSMFKDDPVKYLFQDCDDMKLCGVRVLFKELHFIWQHILKATYYDFFVCCACACKRFWR